MAHSPLRMLWLGGRVLLAFQTGYALLNIESGDQTQLATMARGTPPAAVALASGEVVVALEGHSQIFSAPTPDAWPPPPCTHTHTHMRNCPCFQQPSLLAVLKDSMHLHQVRLPDQSGGLSSTYSEPSSRCTSK